MMAPGRTRLANVNNMSLDELSDKLSGDGKLIVSVMINRFDSMKKEFFDLLATKNREVEELRDELCVMKKKVSLLEGTIDDGNAYERRDTVIFSGSAVPVVSNGENCRDIVINLVKEKLRIELPISEINIAHRLGKKPISQAPDKRNIIVKLCRRDMKREIMVASRNSQYSSSTAPSGPSLFINESLTPKRQTILYALRQIKRAHPTIVVGCTSIDGRVYAYTKPPNLIQNSRERSVRHPINTHEDLTKFCRDYVKLPLETFLETWNH